MELSPPPTVQPVIEVLPPLRVKKESGLGPVSKLPFIRVTADAGETTVRSAKAAAILSTLVFIFKPLRFKLPRSRSSASSHGDKRPGQFRQSQEASSPRSTIRERQTR